MTLFVYLLLSAVVGSMVVPLIAYIAMKLGLTSPMEGEVWGISISVRPFKMFDKVDKP